MVKEITLMAAVLTAAMPGCGPSCPEVKAELDVTAAITGDVTRVNELVARRRAAIAEAERGGHDSFHLQRLKFSVTALEMAIATQARIIKASPRFEDAPSYETGAGRINEFRCFLDKLLSRDGHTVSDGVGEALRTHKTVIDRLLDRDGAITPAELRSYYEKGITVAGPADEEPTDEAEAQDGDSGEE